MANKKATRASRLNNCTTVHLTITKCWPNVVYFIKIILRKKFRSPDEIVFVCKENNIVAVL